MNILKKTIGALFFLYALSLYAENIVEMTTNTLKFGIDGNGKITYLVDQSSKTNYVMKNTNSYLLRIQNWSGKVNPKNNPMLDPISASLIKKNSNSATIELKYKNGEKLQVLLVNKGKYIKMKVLEATPLNDISKISWGPYFLDMLEPVGMYIGIARSKDFSIGMISLDMNTDGAGWDHTFGAMYDRGGTKLIQISYDRSKPRALRQQCKYIISTPIKNLTVEGSSVALFGIKQGRVSELKLLENIEIAEKLPHPMFKGKWTKRSREMKSPCLWLPVNENDIDKILSLAKDFAAGSVCQFHGFFSNWGHFDISTTDYPTGIEGVKNVSSKCAKIGIHNTTYTLTTFLKPHPDVEPYIAPIPDDRLAFLKLDSELSLAEPITSDANSMKLKLSNGLTDELKDALKRFRKVLRIDNEMIEFKSWKSTGDDIIICENLERGGWLTTTTSHKAKTKARYMFVSGYNNFYPGNQDMNMEVAEHIGKVSADGGIGKIILDGYESILISGDDAYGRNTFIQKLYDMSRNQETLFSGSNLGNYSWHIMSFMSWGEFDKDKGFRGTMLENRLKFQTRLISSLIPNKLGQYYPDKDTSIEDIEWLCNQISGWDSGVDLCMDYDNIHQNPDYDKLTATFRLWEEARINQVFNEKQKLNLRQTTSVYRLIKTTQGKYKLKFIRNWIDGRAKVMPSSSINLTSLDGDTKSITKCSAKWVLTHNPGIYSRLALSNDIIYRAGTGIKSWNINLPSPIDSRASKDIGLRCIIRFAPGAKCGVKNIKLKCNGQLLHIGNISLKPGEYFAIPHNNQYGYIYDSKTNFAKKAVFIHQNNPYWFLPTMHKGKDNKIELSCSSIDNRENPEIVVNIQYYDKFFPKK